MDRQAEIQSGQVVVLAEEECHFVAGDARGAAWGPCNQRLTIPLENLRQRQTYSGVMNLQTQHFQIFPHAQGNSEHTAAFLKTVRALHPHQKLILLWDRASYHRSRAVQQYLQVLNQGLEEKDWNSTCLFFAPHAPDQNPVEDVWLQGKNFLRRHFYENQSFHQMKWSFFPFINQRVFHFNKVQWYLDIPQTV